MPKWRRIDVDATSSRHIDVNTASFYRHVPAGYWFTGNTLSIHSLSGLQAFIYLGSGHLFTGDIVFLTLLHSERPKLHRVLAVLSATVLRTSIPVSYSNVSYSTKNENQRLKSVSREMRTHSRPLWPRNNVCQRDTDNSGSDFAHGNRLMCSAH